MNNLNTTRLFAVTAAIIGSLCMYSKADAQYNGSNSSGTNTTSFTGAPNSIWSGDRAPIIVTPEPSTKVLIPTVTPVKPPILTPVSPPVQKLIPPVSCEYPACGRPIKPVRKVYPKTKNKAPRGLG